MISVEKGKKTRKKRDGGQTYVETREITGKAKVAHAK